MKLSLCAMVVGLACVTACGSSSSDGGGNNGNNNGGGGSAADAGGGTEAGAPPGTIPGGNGDAGGGNNGNGGSSATGCDGAKLLAVPADTGARGPWAVGAKTVTINGLVTEVWYPAAVGSDAGKTKAQYDIREHLPDADKAKIPDADNPYQPCNCFRDLPLDTDHGPYPVVVFIHGTAGFRTQSLTFNTHWASRGFVVVSSDHPGIMLADILAGGFGAGADQTGNARKVLDALKAPSGDVAFLAGHIDMTRIGAAGHSAGGGAVAPLGDVAQVIIPMAARGANAAAALKSTLVMGGDKDMIAQYAGVKNGYTSSPKKKRLVGLTNAGHLAFSDLCFIGRDKGGILKIASDHGVNVPALVATLATDGCQTGRLSAEDGWAIINRASAAALEETLTCSTTAAQSIAGLKGAANITDYSEDL